MMVIGIDAHKRTHTAVVVDQTGRQLSTKTIGTTSKDHLSLLRWANEQCGDRLWAIVDCRHLSRRLERDLIAAGERWFASREFDGEHLRDGVRTYGKSDPIDALAVARAALREPNLPEARLDGAERELRLLVDHREDLVAERTRIIARLRWHLHELDPGWKAPTKIDRTARSIRVNHTCRTHRALSPNWRPDVEHLRRITVEIDEITGQIITRTALLAP